MQWNSRDNGGFSPAPRDRLVRPVRTGGPYGFERRNVASRLRDPDSRLNWFRRLSWTRTECREIGSGRAVSSAPRTGPKGHIVPSIQMIFDAPSCSMFVRTVPQGGPMANAA